MSHDSAALIPVVMQEVPFDISVAWIRLNTVIDVCEHFSTVPVECSKPLILCSTTTPATTKLNLSPATVFAQYPGQIRFYYAAASKLCGYDDEKYIEPHNATIRF